VASGQAKVKSCVPPHNLAGQLLFTFSSHFQLRLGHVFDYNRNMSPALRRHIASLVTTVIMGYILYRVLDRLFVVIWVQVPWWGLVILGILLFLAVEFMVNRAFGVNSDRNSPRS
jgi:hypothetical protein